MCLPLEAQLEYLKKVNCFQAAPLCSHVYRAHADAFAVYCNVHETSCKITKTTRRSLLCLYDKNICDNFVCVYIIVQTCVASAFLAVCNVNCTDDGVEVGTEASQCSVAEMRQQMLNLKLKWPIFVIKDLFAHMRLCQRNFEKIFAEFDQIWYIHAVVYKQSKPFSFPDFLLHPFDTDCRLPLVKSVSRLWLEIYAHSFMVKSILYLDATYTFYE